MLIIQIARYSSVTVTRVTKSRGRNDNFDSLLAVGVSDEGKGLARNQLASYCDRSDVIFSKRTFSKVFCPCKLLEMFYMFACTGNASTSLVNKRPSR
jgi:hypothetical protein